MTPQKEEIRRLQIHAPVSSALLSSPGNLPLWTVLPWHLPLSILLGLASQRHGKEISQWEERKVGVFYSLPLFPLLGLRVSSSYVPLQKATAPWKGLSHTQLSIGSGQNHSLLYLLAFQSGIGNCFLLWLGLGASRSFVVSYNPTQEKFPSLPLFNLLSERAISFLSLPSGALHCGTAAGNPQSPWPLDGYPCLGCLRSVHKNQGISIKCSLVFGRTLKRLFCHLPSSTHDQ